MFKIKNKTTQKNKNNLLQIKKNIYLLNVNYRKKFHRKIYKQKKLKYKIFLKIDKNKKLNQLKFYLHKMSINKIKHKIYQKNKKLTQKTNLRNKIKVKFN